MEKNRHPFRNTTVDSVTFRALDKTSGVGFRQSSQQSSTDKAHLSDESRVKVIDSLLRVARQAECCCVQGAQCSASAPVSLLNTASYLQSSGTSVLVLLPSDFENSKFCKSESSMRIIYYFSCAELKRLINICNPLCILLSSYDMRFEAVRRDARTIRWAHEMPRAYDPQASRCFTPLYGTCEAPLSALSGYAGLARSFCSFEHLEEETSEYNPGPIRILGVGDISNPRVNFKAFQYLAEKHTSALFIWHGATRNKTWGNLQLCTADISKTSLLSKCDYLLWCPEDDPCPITVFEALYMGVRVFVFEKVISFNLPQLFSDRDGTPLLDISKGAAQHCPLHVACKNTKAVQDIAQGRAYAPDLATSPPLLLTQHVQRMAASRA